MENLSSLKALQLHINQLIEDNGEDAPVVWWIYTKSDIDNNVNLASYDDEKKLSALGKTQQNVEIYSYLFDCIKRELQNSNRSF